MQIEGIGPETAPLLIKNLPKFFKMLDEIDIPCRGASSSYSPEREGEREREPKPQHDTEPKHDAKDKPKKKQPVPPPPPQGQPSTNIYFNKQTVVFTGVRNKDLEKIIEAAGGKVTTSISKNTTLVITKDVTENNAKLNKARELNIKIISIASVIG
jgi:NAD-dependent DNA ligase